MHIGRRFHSLATRAAHRLPTPAARGGGHTGVIMEPIMFAVALTAAIVGGIAWYAARTRLASVRRGHFAANRKLERDLGEVKAERDVARNELAEGRLQAQAVRDLINPEVASESDDTLADLVKRLLTKLRGTEESRKSVAEAHDRALKELAATRARISGGLKAGDAEDRADMDATVDRLADRLAKLVESLTQRLDRQTSHIDELTGDVDKLREANAEFGKVATEASRLRTVAESERDIAKRDLREANADAEVRLGNLATTLEEGRQALGAAGDEFLLAAAQRVIGERDAARGDANEMREALARNVKGTEATVREIGAERDEAREAARSWRTASDSHATREAALSERVTTLEGEVAELERENRIYAIGRKEIGVHVHQGRAGRWRWSRIIDGKTVANGPGSYNSREKAVAAAKNAHPGLLVVVA